MKINGRLIGAGAPVYIVAEMSANHNRSYEKAEEIVRAAKAAGADAVKLQTYTADTITLDCRGDPFRVKGTLWDGRTLHDLYEEAYTPWDWQPRLKALGESLGLDVFSAPFDESAVDFLEEMAVAVYKIASFELNHLPLLGKVARTGKPVVLSTGMASEAEIEEALETLRAEGCREFALLKCTSAYPAPPEEANLRTIPEMARRFNCPVGLSDHTLGIAVPAAAAALGACLIEKHFTLSRKDPGPDSAFSLEPAEFKAMAESVRAVEKALGQVDYGGGREQSGSRKFRRSLFAAEDIRAGKTLTEKNVRCVRPADGLHPRYWEKVLGLKARRDIPKGTPLAAEMIEGAGPWESAL